MNGENQNAGPDQHQSETGGANRVGSFDETSDSASRILAGSSYSEPENSASSGAIGATTSGDGNNLRKRHLPRVPGPDSIETLETQLVEAFQQGDPNKVWTLTQELIQLAKKTQLEAAKLRFSVNFGTDVCERCDGLRAGDDVVATCFQIKQCYYASLKKSEITFKQMKVIDNLNPNLEGKIT